MRYLNRHRFILSQIFYLLTFLLTHLYMINTEVLVTISVSIIKLNQIKYLFTKERCILYCP